MVKELILSFQNSLKEQMACDYLVYNEQAYPRIGDDFSLMSNLQGKGRTINDLGGRHWAENFFPGSQVIQFSHGSGLDSL